MNDTTETLNRRQRVDAAEANLDRAVMDAASAEKRKMRAMQELSDSDERLTHCVQVIDKARTALAEALAYRDAPLPSARPPAEQLTEITKRYPANGAIPGIGDDVDNVLREAPPTPAAG